MIYRTIGRLILVTFILTVMLLSWLVLTESGLSAVLTLTQKYVPELAIKKASGRLVDGAVFEQIDYQLDEHSRVSINNVVLSWQAIQLLTGRFTVDELMLDDVLITQQLPDQRASVPISLPYISSPLPVYFENIRVNTVTVVSQGQEDVELMSNVKAALNLWGDDLTINYLSVESTDKARLKLNGSIQLSGDYQTALAYEWVVIDPEFKGLTGQGSVKGNSTKLRVEQQVVKPVRSTNSLTISDLFDKMNWHLDAQVAQVNLADYLNDQTGQFNDVEIVAHGDLKQAQIKFKTSYKQEELPTVIWSGQLASRDFDSWTVDSALTDKNGLELSIEGDVKNAATSPTMALTGQWQQLVWPLSGLPNVMTSRAGKFNINGDIDHYIVAMEGALETQQQAFTFDAEAEGSSTKLGVKQLQLKGLGGEATIAGWVSWQQEIPIFEVNATLQNITLPKELSEAAIVIKRTRLDLAGTVADIAAKIDADLVVNSMPMSVDATADISQQGAKNIIINTGIASGRMGFIGEAQWQDKRALNGTVKLTKVNPAFIAPQWPGELSGRWVMAAENINGETADISIKGLDVRGTLRQRPIRLKTDLSYLNQRLNIPVFQLNSGQSEITATGQMKERLTLNWRINSPNLADFYPELTGSLKASGTVSGHLAEPTVSAKIEANTIVYSDLMSIDKLVSDFSLDISQQGHVGGKWLLSGLSIEKSMPLDAELDMTGTIDKHQLTFDLVNKDLKVSGLAAGALSNKIWQGQFTRLKLEHAQAGQWDLTEQGKILVASDHGSLDKHCMQSQNGSVCLQANYSPKGNWRINSELAAIPMTLLQSFSSSLEPFQGNLKGQFELTGKDQYPISGRGNISLKEGRVSLENSLMVEEGVIALRDATINYQVTEQGGVANVLIEPDLQGVSALTGQLRLPHLKTVIDKPNQANLSGYLTMTAKDLAVFGSLHPEYENLHGQLTVDMKLTGTVAKPATTGKVLLDNAGVELSSLGIVLSAISATVVADLATGIKLKYEATSGDGHLSGDGQVMFADKGWSASSTLTGDNIELLNLPEAHLIASPDLLFKMTPDSAHIEGSITVPTAELAPVKFNIPVTVSKDVIVINDKSAEEAGAIPTRVKLNVILGEKVHVKGFGFDGRLTGKLLVTGHTDKILLGTGELLIKEGSYTAYGQQLAIENGKVHFSGGALDNPDLDIKAVRQEKKFTAGLQLLGSADNPQIQLFSTPSMSDDNVLAHLLLGRPLEDASVADAAMLASAASGLGIKGGNMIGEQIANTFGLDSFTINGNGGENTALQIGKYLLPNLYLSYGVGIFDPVSTVNLRYELSKLWSLKAESGAETGVDLLYVREQ